MAIKKKTAKVMALRTATGVLFNALSLDWEDVDMNDVEAINKELEQIAEAMYKRAVKLGGDFNKYSGY
jgi:hypothetical protein